MVYIDNIWIDFDFIRTALSGTGKTSYWARVESSLLQRRPCASSKPAKGERKNVGWTMMKRMGCMDHSGCAICCDRFEKRVDVEPSGRWKLDFCVRLGPVPCSSKRDVDRRSPQVDCLYYNNRNNYDRRMIADGSLYQTRYWYCCFWYWHCYCCCFDCCCCCYFRYWCFSY